ncbi:hypothetical protein NY537_14775 [Curtobacterium flaccumfaciens pv. betae]|nr:hypothetical protein [Curtobacterium flaccumfaciens]MCS5514005.1 hypothetical protein [Curtobacterium flaccumfaciens pv. betae]
MAKDEWELEFEAPADATQEELDALAVKKVEEAVDKHLKSLGL